MDSYHDFIIAFDYLMLYISRVWVLSLFKNHLLAGCFWSCVSFRCCNFQSVFPLSLPFSLALSPALFHCWIRVDPKNRMSGPSFDMWICILVCIWLCRCVCMPCIHINNDLLSKSLAFGNDDDGNRIIRGREVKFMLGNAFLQSHCLWTVTNVSTSACTHAFSFHSLAHPFWLDMYAHAPSDKQFAYRSHRLSVYEFYLKIVMINCYLFPSIIELWCLSQNGWDGPSVTRITPNA